VAKYRVPKNNILSHTKPGVTAGLKEFAPPGGGGDDDNLFEILRRLAAQWWNGDEDPRAERTLASMGWEIGQDDGYDNGGVFVVRAGDEHGKSYTSWPAEDLEGLSESDTDKIADRYDPEEFDQMVLRLKTLAGAGPLKTVWDPERRVYRNVPINQPQDQK
jgi:hypothetical protein